jgi:MFS family permease
MCSTRCCSTVAPNCVPTLLGLEIGSAAAKQATLYWTGLLTSLLLIGWACGGVLFGMIADRIGRTRTLMLTMLLYALGTAACAAAPNILWLAVFRLVASLGIGGEWAAGASMVAEVVPEEKRVEAGALLYTAAPLGLFLATFVNHQVAAIWMAESPRRPGDRALLAGSGRLALSCACSSEPGAGTLADAAARDAELFGPTSSASPCAAR